MSGWFSISGGKHLVPCDDISGAPAGRVGPVRAAAGAVPAALARRAGSAADARLTRPSRRSASSCSPTRRRARDTRAATRRTTARGTRRSCVSRPPSRFTPCAGRRATAPPPRGAWPTAPWSCCGRSSATGRRRARRRHRRPSPPPARSWCAICAAPRWRLICVERWSTRPCWRLATLVERRLLVVKGHAVFVHSK